MSAHEHQSLTNTLSNHAAHLICRCGVQKRRGFIEHVHRQVPQPSAQQAEAVDFDAADSQDRKAFAAGCY
ncbi:hypothetical protein [Synechococcus sp. ROS8604]|uniref:hypothetical protein n=1 Tax=Synechococcus sp. ROS8604 TaxID=1442557 RepID=UPI0016463B38|nr:hypothetical protein [Synechococcus sp. ROS8604]